MVVNYVCSNCLKEFNLKGNYTQHLNRKKPCLAVIPKIQVIKEENPLQCYECLKHFSTRAYILMYRATMPLDVFMGKK